MAEKRDNRPIGVFDSGLGGLTAVTHLAELLPEERAFIEFAMDYCSQHNIDVMQAP